MAPAPGAEYKRTPMAASRTAAAWIAVLGGCASAVGAPPPSTGTVTLCLLGDGFAERDGRRLPLDDCLVDLRVLAREAGAERGALPKVVVQLADPTVTSAVLDAVLEDLQRSGYAHVVLEGR